MDVTEIYKYTADYALKNGGSELFHASVKVNKQPLAIRAVQAVKCFV